jgi:hypothetical protein
VIDTEYKGASTIELMDHRQLTGIGDQFAPDMEI